MTLPYGEKHPDFVPPQGRGGAARRTGSAGPAGAAVRGGQSWRQQQQQQHPAAASASGLQSSEVQMGKADSGGAQQHADPTAALPPASVSHSRRGSHQSGLASPRAGSATASRRHSSVVSGSGKGGGEFFRVFLRVRPYLESERDALIANNQDDARSGVEVTADGDLLLLEEKALGHNSASPYAERKRLTISDHFSEAIWSFGEDPPKRWDDEIPHQNRSQSYVFRTLNSFGDTTVVHRLYDGFNHCIMTYGAMNAGKTHTMFGDAKDIGLAARFLEKAALRAPKTEQKFEHENMRITLEVSLVRVWKETVEDLLAKDSGAPSSEFTFRNVCDIDGITTQSCKAEEELAAFMGKMQKYRKPSAKTEMTKDNRSHVILTLVITQHSSFRVEGDAEEDDNPTVKHSRKSTLTLVDLGTAGRAEGETPQDGKLISMAPQAMARVMTCLSSRSAVPYRDSVLTQLLQEELGGNCNTTFVGCISPNARHCNDNMLTLETLKRLQSVTSKVVKAENKELTMFRDLNNAQHQAKKQIHKESSAIQKVRDKLLSLQVDVNSCTAENKRLHDILQSEHKQHVAAEDARKRLCETLKAVKRFRKVLLPQFDCDIRALRTKKSEYKKRTKALQDTVQEEVGLERFRAERLDGLRTKVEDAAMLVGLPDVHVGETVPVESEQFDATAEYIEKLLANLELRLKSKRSADQECDDVMRQIQLVVRDGEEIEDDLRAAEMKLAKLQDSVLHEKKLLLRRASQQGITLHEGVHDDASADEGRIDFSHEAEIAEYIISTIRIDEAQRKLLATQDLHRTAISGAYDDWAASLPPISVYTRLGTAVHGLSGCDASKQVQAQAQELRQDNEKAQGEMFKLQEGNAKREGELEALRLVYDNAMQDLRWRQEKQQEEKMKERQYEEERKKREDELALAKVKAEQEAAAAAAKEAQHAQQLQALQQQLAKQKEKGGCCAVS